MPRAVGQRPAGQWAAQLPREPARQPVSECGGRADGRAPRPAAPSEGRRRELVPAARAAVVAEARSAGL